MKISGETKQLTFGENGYAITAVGFYTITNYNNPKKQKALRFGFDGREKILLKPEHTIEECKVEAQKHFDEKVLECFGK